MTDIVKTLEGNRLLLKLSKKVYEKEAIFAAAYKFTNHSAILIEPIEDTYVGVYFEPKENQTQDELKRVAFDFCNEVIDQQVRLDLEKRYGNIKEIIVKHSFSPLKSIKEAIRL